jgi:hypothetical protein
MLVLGATAAHASIVVYDNTSNSEGIFVPANIVGTGTVALPGNITDIQTGLVADDITPITGYAGMKVESMTLQLINNSNVDLTFQPLLRFYNDDGPVGPGSLIVYSDTGLQTIAKKTTQKFIFTIGGGTFLLPSGTFWAGVAFDSFGSNITAADFGNFGAGVYNPPTIGSSDDLLFVSSGTGLFKTNSPAGSLGIFGPPYVSSLGWAFTVAEVPEPGTGILFLFAVPLVLRARRRT